MRTDTRCVGIVIDGQVRDICSVFTKLCVCHRKTTFYMKYFTLHAVAVVDSLSNLNSYKNNNNYCKQIVHPRVHSICGEGCVYISRQKVHTYRAILLQRCTDRVIWDKVGDMFMTLSPICPWCVAVIINIWLSAVLITWSAMCSRSFTPLVLLMLQAISNNDLYCYHLYFGQQFSSVRFSWQLVKDYWEYV